MKLCKDCKNRGKKRNCELYTSTSNYAERCKDFEQQKQTNADRIRSMSDEELAEFLDVIEQDGIQSQCTVPCDVCTEKTECANCWKDWLQSEVEG